MIIEKERNQWVTQKSIYKHSNCVTISGLQCSVGYNTMSVKKLCNNENIKIFIIFSNESNRQRIDIGSL